MLKIMVEVEVPDGRYCRSKVEDCHFYNRLMGFCKLFKESLLFSPRGARVYKTPKCLDICNGKKEEVKEVEAGIYIRRIRL
jgi:hypothetical protein